jgi:hypothetical protein
LDPAGFIGDGAILRLDKGDVKALWAIGLYWVCISGGGVGEWRENADRRGGADAAAGGQKFLEGRRWPGATKAIVGSGMATDWSVTFGKYRGYTVISIPECRTKMHRKRGLSMGEKKGWGIIIVIVIIFLMMAGCSSDSGSSYSSYSTRESRYDAKYGEGEFQKDLDLYYTMKNNWPGN